MATGKKASSQPLGLEQTNNRWGVIVVIAAHLNLTIQECGARSCDVFFLSWRDEFDTNAQETAAVQSILASVANFSNLIGGFLNKRFGCKLTGVIGGLLAVTGTFGSVWVRDISQLYVTAAIAGAGLGITVNTAVVAVALNFKKRYKTANALAYAGCGTGKMAMPPLIQLLLMSYGWRGAMLIISAIAANIVVFATLFRPPRKRVKEEPDINIINISDNLTEETKEDLLNRQLQPVIGNDDVVEMESATDASSGGLDITSSSSVKYTNAEDRKSGGYESLQTGPSEPKPKVSFINKVSSELGLTVFRKSYRYSLLCPLALTASISYFGTPLFIIPRAQSIGVAPSSAALILSMNGVGGLLGRLANGLLISCKLSAEIVCSICAAVAGASLLLLNLDNYICLFVASFLQGFFSGVMFSILIVLIRRYIGCKQFSVCVGFYYFCLGIGSLVGPLFAGWLFDITESYETIFYIQAGVFFVCCIGICLIPVLKRLEPGIGVDSSDKNELAK
ncbi:monocarboxylate transporter 12-like [Patiria miniata]|uniref:Major facilitator superfamily (MFS) profile domain-containing protein n=1 Tax=Patiria miniata TaxID=46514 RepID=A0A913ZFF5_PATMI|nr:monocarboxylate transporter 12-like [Patiria miniata]